MPFRNRYTGLIEHYRDRLPVRDDTRIISLGEGDTPLIRLDNIPRALRDPVDIYVKYEGLNPTGSFKDRGMTLAVTKAVEEGSNDHLRLDRQHFGLGGGLCGARRYHLLRAHPRRQDRARQACPGDDPRRGGDPD